MIKAAFVGFGELGLQMLDLAELSSRNPEHSIVCFDDQLSSSVFKVFPFSKYQDKEFADYSFYVALGYKHLSLKNKILQELHSAKRRLPSIIHSTCYVSSSAQIDEACCLYPMCNIDKNVRIKKGTLLNNSVTISHDNTIGECCYLSPGVVLSGNVKVGDNTFMGSGTIVSNGISIGKNVIIGIGSVITKDIPDGASVIGNPGRIIAPAIRLK